MAHHITTPDDWRAAIARRSLVQRQEAHARGILDRMPPPPRAV